MEIKKTNIVGYKYAFITTYRYDVVAFCRYLKEKHSWKNFSYLDNAWRFDSVSIVNEIINRFPEVTIDDDIIIDLKLHELAKKTEREKNESIRYLKEIQKSEIKIEGLRETPYGYQLVGVDFLSRSGGKAILADSPGSGKSMQTIGYVIYTKKNKTLIVSPSNVKYAWEKEIKKWSYLKPFVVTSQISTASIKDKKADVFIINYEIFERFASELAKLNFDCLVVDEFTYIKNPKAKRTKVLKKFSKLVSSVIFLSGTPILSRPVELYNALSIISPEEFGDYYTYTKNHCNGHRTPWGWDAKGSSNLDELHEKIYKYYLRRTKDEILPFLPPKNIIKLPIELDKSERSVYKFAENKFAEFLRSVKKKKNSEIKKSLQAEKLVRLGELRRITSEAKIKHAEELIDSIVDSGEKVLLFSCYNEPLEKLYKKYKKRSVILTGKTKDSEKELVKDMFQNNPNVKIFFGGIQSAGIGITLTAADNVIFLDYSWNPSDHEQATDRIHRIGQKASHVDIYYLYALDTTDEMITKLLEKKSKIFSKLIDGKEAENDIFSANQLTNFLLEEIENKA